MLVQVRNVTGQALKGEFFGHGVVTIPAGAVVTLPLAVADAFNARAGRRVLELAVEDVTPVVEVEDKPTRRKRGE